MSPTIEPFDYPFFRPSS